MAARGGRRGGGKRLRGPGDGTRCNAAQLDSTQRGGRAVEARGMGRAMAHSARLTRGGGARRDAAGGSEAAE